MCKLSFTLIVASVPETVRLDPIVSLPDTTNEDNVPTDVKLLDTNEDGNTVSLRVRYCGIDVPNIFPLNKSITPIETPCKEVNGDCKTPLTVIFPETTKFDSVPTDVKLLETNEEGNIVSL